MIDKIYIPTYRRLHRQLSYDSLPPALQDRVRFVLAPDEVEAFAEKYGEEKVLDCPEKGIAPVRRWIAYHAKETGVKKYAVLDDDNKKWYHRPITEGRKSPPSIQLQDDEIIHLFDKTISEALDEYVQVGLWPRSRFPSPPEAGDIQTPSIVVQTQFFNGERLPVYDIEWTRFKYCEDYDIAAQLIKLNMPPMTFRRWCFDGAPAWVEGGCSAEGRDPEEQDRCALAVCAIHSDILRPHYDKKSGRTYARAKNLSKSLERIRSQDLESFFS